MLLQKVKIRKPEDRRLCIKTRGKTLPIPAAAGEGRIQTRNYDDRDGNKRYITEVVADQMLMLGPKPEEKPRTQNQNRYPQPDHQDSGGFHGDDDIPF